MKKLWALFLVAASGSAHATLVTYEFTGYIFSAAGEAATATAPRGAEFSGNFTIARETPMSSSSTEFSSTGDVTRADYATALVELYINVDGYYEANLDPDFQITPTSDNRPSVAITNNYEGTFQGDPALIDRFSVFGGLSTPAANGNYGYIFVTGVDYTGTNFSSVSLDQEVTNLGSSEIWDILQIQMSWVVGNSNETPDVFGRIETLTLTSVIPVPAAVWLFGSALLGLGWMSRRGL